ncbi:TIGR03557 family F420-dependent LLM class oxidoreductase [Streptomonospora nanhaiensis]|uniref:TIGR03557 family F420-dependent LLM class oxidoreductase n=1 Tax=Streptomonospora nanhaiensis TaxID=1323731 RepID=UPI001C38AE6E|nr:TIGR03557 family F420-dependent LLM class oxidoreductase [Streptomonospora nanhaiensis]MBV2364021.1 TIGR03557 family F420-dependent LLM class oxidoreductase [Streptomonospora nanhaiensis]
MLIGYKLFAEGYSPQEMVRQAERAEAAGFDFVEISDHYHPWLNDHGHSGFAWSILAAIAARTERIGLATGVTCPFIRYHPAIVAQAAATTALLSEGRFILGVGAGEQLNEHVVGRPWPAARERHEMLREALEIIRLLWQGGYHSYEGRHLRLVDAQVFDLPEVPPQIAVAISGPSSARIAADLGDAVFATEPKPELVRAYTEAGGRGPRYAEVPLSWAPDDDTALESAHRMFRFGVTGWKVQAELPNVVNFEAATAFVRPEDLRSSFGYGPDPERHAAAVQQFADAGFDRLALVNAGPDPDGFFDFFEKELNERLRAIAPAR